MTPREEEYGVLVLVLAMVLQRATGNKHFEFASSWVSRGKDWMSTLPERQSGNTPSRSEWGRVAGRGLGAQRKEKDKAEKDLKELFDPSHFGKEGEWKKLDKMCLEHDSGE